VGCAEAMLVTGSKYCLNTTCQERLRTEVRYEIPNIPTRSSSPSARAVPAA